MSGLALKDVISQKGTFCGMYPTTLLDYDGYVRPYPISIVQDQQAGPIKSIHFQDTKCRLYNCPRGSVDDKREGGMPALASYKIWCSAQSAMPVCIPLY